MEDFVNARMPKPVENLMSLFEPNWGHAWKQDLKMLREMAALNSFVVWNQRREVGKIMWNPLVAD